MKNILIIATYFPPMGGVGTVRVAKYVKYLKTFNWKPTIITIDQEHITNYDETLLKDIDKDIEIIQLNLNRENKKIEIMFYEKLKKEIDSILRQKKYDVVFVTGGPFEPMKIAPYIYKKYKIPYIIDLRDPWKLQKMITTTALKTLKAKAKRFIVGISERKVFKNAFAICTVNDTMTNQYQNEYPKMKNKFVTIPNGYDQEDYEKIQPKKLQGFNIIYAGKFGVSAGFRNPKNIFKAIKRVNNNGIPVHFVHVGQEEEKVIEIAKKEDVMQFCTFVGRKSYKESLEYCKGANILLAIGGNEKSEQTGKIFDYIGCSKPILVIANKDSEIVKVCEEIENSYCIEKEDINGMVKAIMEINKNQANTNKIEMIEKYTRKHLTQELVEILNKI